MSSSKIWTGIVVVCVVAVGALAWKRITFAHDVKRDTKQAHELEQLRADVANLRASVQNTERTAISAAWAASKPHLVAAEAPAEAARAPAETPAQDSPPPAASLTSDEIQTLMQSRFELESQDPTWSRGAAARITDQVARNITPNSRVVSVDCRRSLCRIESRHDDLDAYRRFATEALAVHDGSWNGTITSSLLGTGKERELTSVGYLVRPGENFEQLVAAEGLSE